MPTQYSIVILEIDDSETAAGSARTAPGRQLHEAVRPLPGIAGVSWQDVLAIDLRDGSIMLALPGSALARIAGPAVAALDGSLAGQAAGDGGVPPVRLRVAIHTGPADGSEPGPSTAAVSHACLLARAQPLRDALRAATQAGLAVIASDIAYASAIRHEHYAGDPEAYLPVRVRGPAGDVTAWVTVPGYPATGGSRAETGPLPEFLPPPVPAPARRGGPGSPDAHVFIQHFHNTDARGSVFGISSGGGGGT